MDSLVGYGSDEDIEPQQYGSRNHSVGHSGGGGPRRREDDTNYDDVNMDMSEDSQAESEPELPPAEPSPPKQLPRDDRHSNESRNNSRDRNREREKDRRDHRRADRDTRRDEREGKDERHGRSERERRGHDSSKRGLLGDRPERSGDNAASVPSLMDMKPFGGDAPPAHSARSHDARDAVSPRFVDRDRRDARHGERERDRDRHSRRNDDGRSDRHRHSERRSRSPARSERSRSRGVAAHAAPETASSSNDRRVSPPGQSADYRPSSYKVNKKLEVMEKMGLQIKTPDGSMATAQQLRQAACEVPPPSAAPLPSYYNPTAVNSSKIIDQVQKRKLLWSGKKEKEAEEAAKWSGTRFAQDNDGKQVSKFMRLMGIKEPAALKPEAPDKTVDPIKKQEELFQAMQAQYEVARATTHTMRGVGLGFQRGQQF